MLILIDAVSLIVFSAKWRTLAFMKLPPLGLHLEGGSRVRSPKARPTQTIAGCETASIKKQLEEARA
jgi:hypothetical protein